MDKTKGFGLIGLIIVIAIIAIFAAIYYKKSSTGGPSPAQVGQKAIVNTQVNNQLEQQQWQQTQDQLNSGQ